jgi:hypothetical protein
MIKVNQATLDRIERMYPGIAEMIRRFENAALPHCPRCGTVDTAVVSCGVIGRSMNIAGATTKFKLLLNPPKPGEYFCNPCDEFFDTGPPGEGDDSRPSGRPAAGERRERPRAARADLQSRSPSTERGSRPTAPPSETGPT